MRVILTEQEILTAIEDYVLDSVKVPEDVRVDIDLKATRGDAGYTAEIDLVSVNGQSDDRIQPTEEARSEGLGIVDKIDAAREEAAAPRRRGRPKGSKNQPKTPAATAETNTTADAVVEHPAHEDAVQEQPVETPATEVTETPEAEAVAEVQAETADTPEVVVDTNVSATNEQMIEQAEANPPLEVPTAEPAKAADVPAADVTTQAQGRSLFGNISDAGDPTPAASEPEPAEEAPTEEPEANSEEALAAEAAATEPTEPEPVVEDTPAPAPTRSLFANLTKPTN